MSGAIALFGGMSVIRYDRMCQAIAEAHAVDEVKDIRDKAAALEMYMRQAQNTEAERLACEIRLRAERRCGELLKQREKDKGGRPAKNLSNHPTGLDEPKTLPELGISRDESSRWQKLADIPEEQFEAALSAPEKPTTAGILRANTEPKPQPVDPAALWLWGRLCDFERDRLLGRIPREVLSTMTPSMLEDCMRLAPLVAKWLEEIASD
jgi:hypothetical protein